MIRCGVYLRQSDDPRDDELAVKRQWDEIVAKICEPRGWEPVRYCDNDRTALGPKRSLPDRDRMLEDIAAKTLQAMAVWDCDRLYREPRDLEDIIDVFDAHHILLATVTGDVDLGTDNGRLFARVKGAFAKGESERRSARQKAKGKQLAEAGEPWGSRRAFGYERDGTLIPREAEALAEAYELVLAGHKLISICRSWNARGIRTSLGNEWRSQGQLTKVLRNPRNMGERAYNGEIVAKAKWAAIVPRDVWQAVDDILADESRRTGPNGGRVYLQVGIALCGGRCAAAEVASTMDTTKTYPSGRPTYRCRTCFGITRDVRKADDLVIDLVIERLSRPDAADLLVDLKRPDLHALRTEAATLRTRLESLALDFAEGDLTKEQLKAATARVKKKLAAAESTMEDANRARLFKGITGENAPLFRQVPLDRQRAIIASLMTITFLPGGRGRFDPNSIHIAWKA